MNKPDPSSITVTHPSPTSMQVKLLSHPATLAPVRKEFEAFAEKAGFDSAARGEIVLVVNEALANVMRHAYGNATDKPIELSVEDTGDAIKIDIRDWGVGKNPDTLPKKQHDPLTPGGLGMVCLRRYMDEITFHPQPDGMRLSMVRRKMHNSLETK